MAAEMQPRFICGQPTHSAAWEGMKSRPGPPQSTPPQKALWGGGAGRLAPGCGADPLGVRQHRLKNPVCSLAPTLSQAV